MDKNETCAALTFDRFMDRVDGYVIGSVGCSVYDLPDYAFRDSYDAGEEAEDVAACVIAEAETF